MPALSISPLRPDDAHKLAAMLQDNGPEYMRYFAPFAFDEQTICRILTQARRDHYWGLWDDDVIAGFFMLRGLDEGYQVPAYGVCVARSHAGRGLLRLTVAYALSWCALNGISELMLKVHPDNVVARRTYEKHGFFPQGVDARNGHLIFRRSIG